jgi:NitT/TauT family transport system substrate-binding protein
MYVQRLFKRPLILAVAALAVGVSACSSSSSSSTAASGGGSSSAGATSSTGASSSAAPSGAPVTGAPEQSNITIGALPSADSVTLQIAEDKGFFKQQGLNVKIITETTTNAGTQGLLSHTMDFTSENYVGMFAQQQAVKGLNLKIVADNSQTSPNLYVMLVPKDSPLTSISQLKGKKVGFPAPGFNFGSMAADILMKPYNESSADFTTVVLPFSSAMQALATHQVDAIFTTEPFITTSEAAAGDRVLTDMLSGPLAGFPTACWGTTASFVQQNPKTVAAFQRAMTQATQVAATNTAYVRSELPKWIPTMKPAIANVITLPTYNTTLTLARMQRVASVVEGLGHLPKNFDVSSMFYPPAGSSSES